MKNVKVDLLIFDTVKFTIEFNSDGYHGHRLKNALSGQTMEEMLFQTLPNTCP
jgi:hypothetical protein